MERLESERWEGKKERYRAYVVANSEKGEILPL
jgi:hypothetical protein